MAEEASWQGFWLWNAGPGMSTVYFVRDVLFWGRSEFQEVAVVVLEKWGKALVLDGLLQSTEFDEHIYHESLVHPAMVSHPNPRRVLILGGGEGATLREVLKHSTVDKAVMVDIDGLVVEVSRRYLPEWHRGAFDDERSRIVIEDAARYVESALSRGEKFDVVIMDLVDPFGPEVARHLYSREFFSKLRGVLADGGVVVTQAGCSYFFPKVYESVLEAARSVFKLVREYAVLIPSFAYHNNFIVMSDSVDPWSLSGSEVDERLRSRGAETRFYGGNVHEALKRMPPIKG